MIALLLFAAAGSAPLLDIGYDLKNEPPPSPPAQEVVIVGRRWQSPRLTKLPPMMSEEDILPPAELRLSTRAKLAATVEQKQLGGVVSNRAMVSLKIGF